nr:unnamed protein product [Callosobruchus analis]
MQKIQRIQNCCIRFVYGIRRRGHVSHKIKECKWPNMRLRRYIHRMNIYHKMIINKRPSYFHRKIMFTTNVDNLNLRHRNQIIPLLHRTALFER